MIICHLDTVCLGACLYVLMEKAQHWQTKCSVYLYGMTHDKQEDGIPHCVVVIQRKKMEKTNLMERPNPKWINSPETPITARSSISRGGVCAML